MPSQNKEPGLHALNQSLTVYTHNFASCFIRVWNLVSNTTGPQRDNTGQGCLRIACQGRYLDPSRRKFQMTGKLHTEGLHDWHSSRNKSREMKSKKIK
jgi:hypothetical protein